MQMFFKYITQIFKLIYKGKKMLGFSQIVFLRKCIAWRIMNLPVSLRSSQETNQRINHLMFITERICVKSFDKWVYISINTA